MAELSLVTGASGFIGSHVVHQLLERGDEVRVLVRHPEALAEVGLHPGLPGLQIVTADLLERDTLPAALDGVGAIFHAAGFISTSARDRRRIHPLNVDITVNLFEECKRHPAISRVVFVSSIFALAGGSDSAPATELSPYHLESLDVDYVRAKRLAELYAHRCCNEGLPIVFTYPCFCYGPGDVRVSSSRLILMFLRRQLRAHVPGGQNAIDVRDAARSLILSRERGSVGEKYIIGGVNRSYEELFGLLSELTGYDPPRVKLPGPIAVAAGRLLERFWRATPLDAQAARLMRRHWYYDDAKAREQLGHTSRPLDETFNDSITWFCGRGMAPWPNDRLRS